MRNGSSGMNMQADTPVLNRSGPLPPAPADQPGTRRTPSAWSRAWSTDAALRALRATLVVPPLFALADQVVGNRQMAVFAAFGGFATLVLTTFGGTRRDKALAHLGLALAGTALVVLGTLASFSTLLAVLVTLPVAFAILFAGVLGRNWAAGAMGALLAFVLPAVSAGTVSMIPARLAGWWMASVAGTAAVLLLASRPPASQLRAAGAALAGSLAGELESALGGTTDRGLSQTSRARNEALRAAFAADPYQPTGMAAVEQAYASLAESLTWSASLVDDLLRIQAGLASSPTEARLLVRESARLMRAVAALLAGHHAAPDIEHARQLISSAGHHDGDLVLTSPDDAVAAQLTFHARQLAMAALSAAADALIATRQADPRVIEQAQRRWYRSTGTVAEGGPVAHVRGMARAAKRHASLRSVWLIKSLRGALALAAAVAVADVLDVQHGFWVALGTLSVLRASASATGSTAMRALAGTVGGFVIGSLVIVAIGSDTAVLWVMLPVSVCVAAYCSSRGLFVAAQAAFTVLVAVLFNLIVPVGWDVGVVRVEDVLLGCAVSVVIGVLLWPRGVIAVVADDLADAFRQGAAYLSESVNWTLGRSARPPAGGLATVTASIRLDGALRALLAEQGSAQIPPDHLWRLVGAAMRLRLTARALARTEPLAADFEEAKDVLAGWAADLTSWYDLAALGLAGQTRGDRGALEQALPGFAGLPDLAGEAIPARDMWICEQLSGLRQHLADAIGPALELSALRRRPWWQR
jgi:hypothetical protein